MNDFIKAIFFIMVLVGAVATPFIFGRAFFLGVNGNISESAYLLLWIIAINVFILNYKTTRQG